MSVEPRSLKELFLAALAVAPAGRDAWLECECGPDAELRRRLRLMLAAHDSPHSLLDSPAAADGPPGAATGAFAGAERPPGVPGEEAGALVAGRYKLVEQIGEGGMGAVWMAQQTEPVKRLVAVKLIKPGMDTKLVLARFEAERQALALMDHPNIAKVLDAGTTERGRPYFVMELVKGVPITRYCDEHRLTPKQRLELFVPVCQAIQHAHQKGIIHRDIKPSNVLVALYDGRPVPKVIDFGIAKAAGPQLTEQTLVTGFGSVVGTLEYMSPEQAELNQLDIDTRSDVYSLGVLLYELLTGTTPLERKRLKQAAVLEALRLIREEEPPRPSTRLSTTAKLPSVAANRGLEPKRLSGLVRGELDWIVMQCLEKDRSRRYETANGLARDVERYLADESVQACPPSAAYRFRKFARRNKGLLTAAAAVAAVLLVAGAAVTWKWWDAVRARDEAQGAERQSRLREAEALVGQARGTRRSRRPGQRFEALAALEKAATIGRELGQPAEWFVPLRNEAAAALALPDVQITQEFGRAASGKAAVKLSEDFELYAQTTQKGACTVRRVADDAEVARLPERGEFALAGFGPGRTLALLGESSRAFELWDVGRGAPVRRLEEKGVASWAFDPRGRFLALEHDDGALGIYELATGTRAHRFAAGEAFRRGWRFHPTQPLLAGISYWRRDVLVRHLETGAVVASVTPPWTNGNGGGDWSPDGRTLLVSQADAGKIQEYVLDLAPLALRPGRSFELPDVDTRAITFNAGGDRFATRGWLGIVDLFDADSGRLLFQTPSLGNWDRGEQLQFDRTGQRMAAARVGDRRDRIGVWSVAAGRAYRYLTPTGSGHVNYGPAVHPGGRLAAMNLSDGAALFDLETGRELAHVSLPGDATLARFDGAGNLLTNGFCGFFRWPVRSDPAHPGRLVVGPPERLPFHKGRFPIAASQDGRVVAQAMHTGYGMGPYAGGWILHPNSPTPRRVDAGTGMNSASVSRDGRWVAFGPQGDQTNVYDAATGERVWQSPAGQGDHGCFSPDGRLLVEELAGGRVYAAGTWEPGPHLGPGVPWDATAEMAVLGQPDGTYRLVELATGREVARLEDPELTTGRAAFSPDGTRLVVEARDGLRVWDLRRIRAGLADLGLDWDAPPFPPAPGGAKGPVEVTVDRGDLELYLSAWSTADQLRGKGDLVAALDVFDKAHAFAPDDADLQYWLASLLTICPDPQRRDLKRAVELANKAVAAAPNNAWIWRALGVAQHFAGDDTAALKALSRSMELRRAGDASDAFDDFSLAAVHGQLGHKEEARRWYDRGAAWMATHKHPYAAELALFRADAEVRLGIGKPSQPAQDRTPPDRKK